MAAAAAIIDDRDGAENETNSRDHQSHRTIGLLLIERKRRRGIRHGEKQRRRFIGIGIVIVVLGWIFTSNRYVKKIYWDLTGAKI